MIQRKTINTRLLAVVLLTIFIVAGNVLGQSSGDGSSTNGSVIVNYSLVPTILLQNIVITPSGSFDTPTSITSVSIVLTILRPSVRD